MDVKYHRRPSIFTLVQRASLYLALGTLDVCVKAAYGPGEDSEILSGLPGADRIVFTVSRVSGISQIRPCLWSFQMGLQS